jgi:Na+-driven multidrug efflux pump
MISGVVNAVLNVILCLILPQKVVAVAVATVTSHTISAILVFNRILKMDGPCKVIVKKMRFNVNALVTILRYGLPMMLVNALFPLSNLQIASAINAFDYLATAGNGAASTIENIISATAGPISITAATFIGQNIGAQKHDRVNKTFWQCMVLTIVFGGVVGATAFFTGRFWLGLIVGFDNDIAITFGLVRMSCTSLFYFVACINNVFGSSLQAYGYSTFSAVNSIFSVFVFRFIWMQGIYPSCADWDTYERFFMVTFCFLVSWLIRMLINIVGFSVVRSRYKRGIRKVL